MVLSLKKEKKSTTVHAKTKKESFGIVGAFLTTQCSQIFGFQNIFFHETSNFCYFKVYLTYWHKQANHKKQKPKFKNWGALNCWDCLSDSETLFFILPQTFGDFYSHKWILRNINGLVQSLKHWTRINKIHE